MVEWRRGHSEYAPSILLVLKKTSFTKSFVGQLEPQTTIFLVVITLCIFYPVYGCVILSTLVTWPLLQLHCFSSPLTHGLPPKNYCFVRFSTVALLLHLHPSCGGLYQ